MKSGRVACRLGLFLAGIAGVVVGLSGPASAGNEGNFVLYTHRTEPAGEVEINTFTDFSRGSKDVPKYSAQLVEIEYAITSKLVSALYFEGQKSDGADYQFGGFRGELRYRPFDYGAFLNPVLYVEYEHLKPEHRYLLNVLGRKDTPERPGPARTEHSIETRLILGHDFSRDFNIAANWINEVNADTGRWEFGYTAGLNWTVWRAQSNGTGLDLRRVRLGAEMFGGLGDSTLGLTADRRATEQYAGLNVHAGFANGMQVRLGGAAGLTGESERFVARLMVGFEMK